MLPTAKKATPATAGDGRGRGKKTTKLVDPKIVRSSDYNAEANNLSLSHATENILSLPNQALSHPLSQCSLSRPPCLSSPTRICLSNNHALRELDQCSPDATAQSKIEDAITSCSACEDHNAEIEHLHRTIDILNAKHKQKSQELNDLTENLVTRASECIKAMVCYSDEILKCLQKIMSPVHYPLLSLTQFRFIHFFTTCCRFLISEWML